MVSYKSRPGHDPPETFALRHIWHNAGMSTNSDIETNKQVNCLCLSTHLLLHDAIHVSTNTVTKTYVRTTYILNMRSMCMLGERGNREGPKGPLGLRGRVTQSTRLDTTFHLEHESGVKLHPGCCPDTLE